MTVTLSGISSSVSVISYRQSIRFHDCHNIYIIIKLCVARSCSTETQQDSPVRCGAFARAGTPDDELHPNFRLLLEGRNTTLPQ
jgi:hypothetical protein